MLPQQLMEIFAGLVEHIDVQVGKVIDELDRLGTRNNTIEQMKVELKKQGLAVHPCVGYL